MNWNPRTAVIVVVSLNLLASGFTVLYGRVVQRYPGVSRWVTGNLLIAAGLLLLGLRRSIPVFLSVILANSLVTLGECLLLVGTSLFVNRPIRVVVLLLPPSAVFLLFSFYTYVNDSIGARIIIISLTWGAIACAIAYILLASPSRPAQLSYWPLASAFILLGIIFLIRAIVVAFSEPTSDLFAPTLLNWIVFFGTIACSAVWSMGFLLLITQRLVFDLRRANEEAKAALAQVKLLEGILPICSFCKKIRDRDNRWQPLEAYVSDHSDAKFTHSVCPACAQAHYQVELGEATQE